MGMFEFLKNKNNQLDAHNSKIISQMKVLGDKGEYIKALELSEKLFETDKLLSSEILSIYTCTVRGAIQEMLGLGIQFMKSKEFDKCDQVGKDILNTIIQNEQIAYSLPKGTIKQFVNKVFSSNPPAVSPPEFNKFLERIKSNFLIDTHIADEHGAFDDLIKCIMLQYLKQCKPESELKNVKTYVSPYFNFKIDYPSSWRVIEKGFMVCFGSPHEGGTDDFIENVNVIVEDMNNEAISLKDCKDSFILNAPSLMPNFELIQDGNTKIDDKDAIFVIYSDRRGETKAKFKLYIIINNGRAYNLTYGAKGTEFNEYLPQAESIMKSIKTN